MSVQLGFETQMRAVLDMDVCYIKRNYHVLISRCSNLCLGLGNAGYTNFPSVVNTAPAQAARMANYTR